MNTSLAGIVRLTIAELAWVKSQEQRKTERDAEDDMSTILARITVKPGKEQDFEDIARELYAASHGTEPALRRYEYWRGRDERVYYTLLAFDDQRGFIDHQTSDHHEEASPKIQSAIESVELEFVDPIAGASPLPPTEHQSAPADASELTVLYTDRFAAQIADWWKPQRRAAAEGK